MAYVFLGFLCFVEIILLFKINPKNISSFDIVSFLILLKKKNLPRRNQGLNTHESHLKTLIFTGVLTPPKSCLLC